MKQFPGYLTERQARRQYSQARARAIRLVEVEAELERTRSLDVLTRALPLLRQYGGRIAQPAEIPSAIPFKRNRISAAWVVKSSCALTEDGLYGSVSSIDRGIPALRFSQRPKPLSLEQMTGGIVYRLQMPDWQHIEETVTSLLSEVGVDFVAE